MNKQRVMNKQNKLKYILFIIIEMDNNILPDNRPIDQHLFILDPLSVIIKLAILSNKSIGTKICISRNIIYFQEPGLFQGLCRYLLKTNKTDLQYMYNPIELACQHYLSKSSIQQNPKLKDLFKCAQNGILKLIETYKQCSIMRLCLNYYYSLISNHLDETCIENLFRKDNMTPLYTTELVLSLHKIWTQDRIKIILNLTTYLNSTNNADTDVKSMETIIDNIDLQTQSIFMSN
jgi:hypothetical protein